MCIRDSIRGACGLGIAGKVGRDIRITSKLTERNTIVDKQILADQNQKLNKLIQKYTNVPLKDLWKVVKGIYKDKGYTAKEALAQARVARILRHGDYNKKTGKVKLWTIR